VNNAGITRDGLFMWMQPEDWNKVINTSLNGFFNVTNFFIQKLLRNKYGRIINMVSVSGLKGTAGQTNYSAAKGALVGATKALAQEVAKRNITVNAVAPGFIKTDMTQEFDEGQLKAMIPANRFGEAEEVADLVAFLASKKSSYITGEVININGGILFLNKMENRVVITGMGIYSCIGITLDEVKNSLYNGKSGIVFDPDRKAFGYRSALTGKVPKPDLKNLLNRRQRISMGEESEYAYLATIDAFKQAKIDDDFLNSNDIGILYGNDSVSQAVVESIDIVKEKKDTALVGSGAIFKSMNSTVTMNLSTIFKLKGINMTISAACASGSHSLGLAYLMIKNGLQDIIVCGGAQETNKFSMASFDGLGVFSVREDEPEKSSRPFDKNRDGLVPSGGAATLIVESYESAMKRGAPIIAEIAGYGFSSNGGHISTPNVEGPKTSMEKLPETGGTFATGHRLYQCARHFYADWRYERGAGDL